MSEDDAPARTIQVKRLLKPPPIANFIGDRQLLGSLGEAQARLVADDRDLHTMSGSLGVDVANEEMRSFSAVVDVVESVEEEPPTLGSYVDASGLGDLPSNFAELRADYEAAPLIREMELTDPANRSYRQLREAVEVRPLGRLAAVGAVRRLFRRLDEEGEVVRLDRVHQPVPVVAGAVPALKGSSGELTAEFERSKSGSIDLTVASAGGTFSVKYSISDSKSVTLPETTSGELVAGFGYLLIPLDRQVLLVPMAKGGEAFPVVRYLPVKGAADSIGWDARAGDASDVADLSLGRAVPLRGTAPQKGSRSKKAAVDATVSLGWENTAKTRSVKASLGISTSVALSTSWELPPGDFTLKWAQHRVAGAVITA